MASLRQLPRGMGVNSGTVTLGHGLASGPLSSQISVHLQLAATASPYGTRWREGKVVPQRALRGKGPRVVWKPSRHSDKELGENTVNPEKPLEKALHNPMETPREDLVLYGSQTVFKRKRKQHQNSNSPYPHHPAPGRGWHQPWRLSHWSGASGWRLWGTCWGCWCLSSQSTGQTSPRAQHLEPRLQVDGRAAAAAAGAGFSLVPSGTAGAGAAAADACSGKRNTHPDKCSPLPPGAQAGR